MDDDRAIFFAGQDPELHQQLQALASEKQLALRRFESLEALIAAHRPEDRGVVTVEVTSAAASCPVVLERLKAAHVYLPVVLVAAAADVPMAVAALQAGGFSLLPLPCGRDELFGTVEQALEREAAERELREEHDELRARLERLNADERTVLDRILQGHSNKQIATELDIGLRTVELRRSRVFQKMEAQSLPELVRQVMIVELPSLQLSTLQHTRT